MPHRDSYKSYSRRQLRSFFHTKYQEPVQGIPSSKRDSSAILVKSLRGVVLDKGKKVYWPLGRNGGPIGAGGGQEPVR